MSHIIVTGATGFIGGALVHELLKRGVKVTALVRPSSNLGRLSRSVGHSILAYRELTDMDIVTRLSAIKPTSFVHCAWRGVAGPDRSEAFQVFENVPRTLQSIQLAQAVGCRQWIGLGSQAEYGNQNKKLSESAVCVPTTSYGKAKLAAGIASLAACEALGLHGLWVRVFSTYGPGDGAHCLIPYLIAEFRAGRSPRLTLCEQLWDYLYVDDAARAIADLVNSAAMGTVNLGSGVAVPMRQVVERVRELVAPAIQPTYGAIPYRKDQIMHLQADVTQIAVACGWRPKISIEDGLVDTVKSTFP